MIGEVDVLQIIAVTPISLQAEVCYLCTTDEYDNAMLAIIVTIVNIMLFNFVSIIWAISTCISKLKIC